jgi:hypothetical protein
MIYVMHDSKRAANNSGRRPQEASGRGQAHGRRTTLPGVHSQKEGSADFLLYSAGHRNGDREVYELIRWKAGLPVVTSNKQTLTSLPSEEEGMAKIIVSALCLQFTHLSRLPGEKGRW